MAVPHLTSITLSYGIVGQSVTIAGTGFEDSPQGIVKFGLLSATITGWTDTEIVCTVPVIAKSELVRAWTGATTPIGSDNVLVFRFLYICQIHGIACVANSTTDVKIYVEGSALDTTDVREAKLARIRALIADFVPCGITPHLYLMS